MKKLKRIQFSALAGFSALSLLAGSFAVSADDIMITGDESEVTDSGISAGSIDAGDSGGSDSGFLIEDTGEEVQYNAGVSMDTLQDAIDSGDTKTLEKIASLGALTGDSSTSNSGIGGGGAYRGTNDDEDVDPDEYYDLQLDEGDADEIETEKSSEKPGRLMAANSDIVQQHLDSMTQVESPTGSDGELTVATYIKTKMGEMGYTVQEQAFHEGVLNEDGIDAPGVNILAERGANSQENRKSDIFLVVTHYDSKRSPDESDPFANDKSGAAALIEAARILAEVVTDTDICFLFLSGEEDGGYGAENFIASLSEENRSRITGVLAVERVGYDSDTPYVLKTMTGESNSLGDIVQQLGLANDANLSLTQDVPDSDEDDGTWVSVGQSSDGYIDEATAAQIAAEQAGTAGPDENAIAIDSSDYIEGEDSGEGSDEMALDEEETEGEPVPMPSAWSYLKAETPSLSKFAGQSFPAVAISQYMPDLDAQSYEETKALGLADTTLDAPLPAEGDAALQAEGDAAAPEAEAAIELEDSNLTGSGDEAPVTLEDAATLQTDAAPEDAAAAAENTDAIPTEETESVDLPEVDAALVADTTNVIAAALAHIMDPAT